MSAEAYYRRYLSQAQLECSEAQIQEYSRKRYDEAARLLEHEVETLKNRVVNETERERLIENIEAYFEHEDERRAAFRRGDDNGIEAG